MRSVAVGTTTSAAVSAVMAAGRSRRPGGGRRGGGRGCSRSAQKRAAARASRRRRCAGCSRRGCARARCWAPRRSVRPAATTRQLISVSISKPSPQSMAVGRHVGRRPAGRAPARVAPEGVVAVAEVGVAGPRTARWTMPLRPALPRLRSGVMSSLPPPGREAGALGEVGAGDQRVDEGRDLGRVGRAVGVEHDDDVAGGGREAAGQRVALAAACLRARPGCRERRRRGTPRCRRPSPRRPGRPRARRVTRAAPLQVAGLVAGGNDDGECRGRAPGHSDSS